MRDLRRENGSTKRPGEAGFALVEVLVSAVLLIVLAIAMFPVLEQSASRASADRGRAIATSLAQAEQDRMRQLPLDQMRQIRVTQTKDVEGLDFVIKSRTDVTRDATGVVTCATSDTAKTEYYRSQTTVTWAGMGNTDPVVIESIINPGVAGLDPTKGSLTVKLQNAAGGPQAGIPVTAGPYTDTTDAGGCAVFTAIPAGPTALSWSAPNMVDRDGDGVGGGSVTVVGNATTVHSDMYDKFATVPLQPRVEGTSTVTQWPVFSLSSGLYLRTFPGAPSKLVPRDAVTATPLFPFTAGYGTYAGSCSGNEPTQYKPDFYTTNANAAVVIGPGLTSPTRTPVLKRITVPYRRTGGAGNLRLTVLPDTSSPTTGMNVPVNCGLQNRRQWDPFGVSSAAGTTTVDLPYGRWVLCIDNQLTGTSARSKTAAVTVTPTGSAIGTTTLSTSALDMTTGTLASSACAF